MEKTALGELKEKLAGRRVIRCIRCGKPFIEGNGRRYCTDECRLAPKEGFRDERPCVICGTMFVKQQARQVTCLDDVCKDENYVRKENAKRERYKNASSNS